MFTLTEPPVQHRLSALDDNYIELGKIDLNEYFITEYANQWIFKVSGDAMSPDIEDGALIVVDTLKKLSVGSIVIVTYQDEFLLKRYVFENGRHKLISTDSDYKTLYIRDINLLEVWGVVVSKHVRI